jgi:hypothetical protein
MSDTESIEIDKELQDHLEEFGSEEIKSKAYIHMDLTLHAEHSKRVYKRLYKFMRHNASEAISAPRRSRVAGAGDASKAIMDTEKEKLEAVIKNDLDLARHQIKEFGLAAKFDEIEYVGTESYKAKYDTPYAKSILVMIKQFDDLACSLTLLYMDGLIEEGRSIDRIYELQQRFYKFSTFLNKHATRMAEGAKRDLIARKKHSDDKRERRAQRKAERGVQKKEIKATKEKVAVNA